MQKISKFCTNYDSRLISYQIQSSNYHIKKESAGFEWPQRSLRSNFSYKVNFSQIGFQAWPQWSLEIFSNIIGQMKGHMNGQI